MEKEKKPLPLQPASIGSRQMSSKAKHFEKKVFCFGLAERKKGVTFATRFDWKRGKRNKLAA
ncbi:hypothetical protein [Hymenobacter sp. DG01]|uniref:hypothetical protein n=1 Tax=Hymenobacter sp. DG01 TaxID=2584940 RepID=UPI00111E7228|nr:hypothetical protein [Hymenobacter sp. DG01]